MSLQDEEYREKRFEAAKAAMSGILSSGRLERNHHRSDAMSEIAKDAVFCAGHLLRQLGYRKPEGL